MTKYRILPERATASAADPTFDMYEVEPDGSTGNLLVPSMSRKQACKTAWDNQSIEFKG